MKIDLRNIPADGLRIETKEPVGILDIKDAGLEFSEPIDVSIIVNRTGNTLLINGEVKTTVGLTCSRCLKKFTQLLRNSDFNLTCDIAGQREVDITPNVREEILILLPVKPLCTKECKGFYPKVHPPGGLGNGKLGRINL